jgi:hypothetical protein
MLQILLQILNMEHWIETYILKITEVKNKICNSYLKTLRLTAYIISLFFMGIIKNSNPRCLMHR